jgi:hypothetical protein
VVITPSQAEQRVVGAAVAGELLDFLAVAVVRPAAAATAGEEAAFALVSQARAKSTVLAQSEITGSPGQPSDFVDQRNRLVVEIGNLRIGRLAIIGMSELPAKTDPLLVHLS